MADFVLSQEEQVRASVLWLSLLEAKGDAAEVARLMGELLDEGMPGEVARVLSVVAALQFTFAWPIVLRRLGESGVSADAMLAEIGAGLGIATALFEQVAALQGVNGIGD